MANPKQPQNAAQKNAERYFRRAEPQPDTSGKQIGKRKRAGTVTIACELRELRLAKAAAKDVADKVTPEHAKRAPTPRSILKMSY